MTLWLPIINILNINKLSQSTYVSFEEGSLLSIMILQPTDQIRPKGQTKVMNMIWNLKRDEIICYNRHVLTMLFIIISESMLLRTVSFLLIFRYILTPWGLLPLAPEWDHQRHLVGWEEYLVIFFNYFFFDLSFCSKSMVLLPDFVMFVTEALLVFLDVTVIYCISWFCKYSLFHAPWLMWNYQERTFCLLWYLKMCYIFQIEIIQLKKNKTKQKPCAIPSCRTALNSMPYTFTGLWGCTRWLFFILSWLKFHESWWCY